jgi:hypothetical protein
MADKIMRQILGNNATIESSRTQLYKENSTTGALYKVGDANAVFNTLNSHLDNNRPITVGVDHTGGLKINEGATDHFVVITGRGYDASRGQYYYNYVETGRYPAMAEDAVFSSKNRLYYDPSTGTFTNPDGYSGERGYSITQIRSNQ